MKVNVASSFTGVRTPSQRIHCVKILGKFLHLTASVTKQYNMRRKLRTPCNTVAHVLILPLQQMSEGQGMRHRSVLSDEPHGLVSLLTIT